MTITVSSGVFKQEFNVSSGNPLIVLSGGYVGDVTVLSGGSATFSSGGDGNLITVSSGGVAEGDGSLVGYDLVTTGGLVSGLTEDGVLNLYGSASSLTVSAGAYVTAYAGATATDTVLKGGSSEPGALYVVGSAAGTIIEEYGEEDVLSGGVASTDTVESGGFEIVSNGGLASAGTVRFGGLETVSSGGAASGTTVQSGGELDLVEGASAGAVTVQSGGIFGYDATLTSDFTAGAVSSTTIFHGVTLSSGARIDLEQATIASGATVSLASAIATSVTVSSGGVLLGPGELDGADNIDAGLISGVTLGDSGAGVSSYLEILSGGSASGVSVVDGGGVRIDAGASIDGAVVSSGYLEVYGSASNTTLGAHSDETFGAGVVVSGETVESGGFVNQFGGTLSDATFESGGELYYSTGTETDVTVQSGGTLDVYGDIESSLTVAPTVTATTVFSGVTLSSGANFNILGATVESGVTLSLAAGATASALTVASGGVVTGGVVTYNNVISGLISGVTASAYAGETASVTLAPGAVAEDVTLVASSFDATFPNLLTVSAGAQATGTVLSYSEISDQGLTVGTVVDGGGEAYVTGSAIGDIVRSGGVEDVYDGGVTTGTTVSSGGESVVFMSVASGTKVLAGGIEYVESPDTSPKTSATTTGTLLSGGEEVVESGGVADASTASGGGWVAVKGGVTHGDILESGGEELVTLAGVASNATVLSGGKLSISSGGSSEDAIISSGGVEGVRGSATSGVVSNGGQLVVSEGGLVSGASVASGGVLDLRVLGVTLDDVVEAGGKEVASSGGLASGTTVLSGGVAYAYLSGVASGAIVSNGGKEIAESGGFTSVTTVLSGGVEYALATGTTIGTTVSNGGKEAISAGGVASGLTVLSGGEVVDDGQVRIAGAGTLAGILEGSGVVIETGGGDLVLSSYGDRDFAGKAAISGGTIELGTVGALGSGYVQFVAPASGSAVLQIDAADAPAAGKTFVNVLSNFSGSGEEVDLAGLSFVAGATAVVSGSTLVLTDGGQTYAFGLAGTTAASYTVVSATGGGTLIETSASEAVARFTQAAAAFAPTAAGSALVPGAASSSQTLFAHAAASAGRG